MSSARGANAPVANTRTTGALVGEEFNRFLHITRVMSMRTHHTVDSRLSGSRMRSIVELSELIETTEELLARGFDHPEGERYEDRLGRLTVEFLLSLYRETLDGCSDQISFRKVRRRIGNLGWANPLLWLRESGAESMLHLYRMGEQDRALKRHDPTGMWLDAHGITLQEIADAHSIRYAIAVRHGLEPDDWERYQVPLIDFDVRHLWAKRPIGDLSNRKIEWFGNSSEIQSRCLRASGALDGLNGTELETAIALAHSWTGNIGELVAVSRSLTA